jgi:uncharacterized membrane protein (UPF0127 family)
VNVLRLQALRRLALASALLAGALACRSGGPVAVIHTQTSGPVEVTLELARTPEEQQRGLMYRTSLADGHGMLFLFDHDTDHRFWMKNTLIPLDMIFIARDGDAAGRIVGIRAEATPQSLAQVGVGKPSRWVLEVPGGWAEAHGVAPGDRVELRGLPG